MNIAVILAGGIGSRLGAGIPKQFVEVLGKPIIAYTIDIFNKHPDVDAILVVCVEQYEAYMREIKKKYEFEKLLWITEGGATFQESMMNGVHYLRDKARSDDIVLFHFGASPFVTNDIISDCIKVCKRTGTNAISSSDYLLLSGIKKSTASVSDPDNYTMEYIDRNTIAVMNTPHAFTYGYITDLYKEATETGIIHTVEPHTTTLMYAMGKKIYFSKGSQDNIKITKKEDLKLFEGYVLAQERQTEERARGDVIVFLADGFEECEALIVVDLLRRAGLSVIMASIMGRRDTKSSRGILVHADCLAENAEYEKAKMIVLPGGRTGVENLSSNETVLQKCKEFAEKKYVAAVCAAPAILASIGVVRKATVHPDYKMKMEKTVVLDQSVVVDGNIITSKGLGTTIPFALELIKILMNEEKSKQIEQDICLK